MSRDVEERKDSIGRTGYKGFIRDESSEGHSRKCSLPYGRNGRAFARKTIFHQTPVNLNEKFPVSQGKMDQLLLRIKSLGIHAAQIEEQFTRGGGHGGQKINKTANCVLLQYPPLELSVRMQKERRRSLNRFLALRELVDQIEVKISPQTSERVKSMEKIRRQKDRRARRRANTAL